jgi:hypothetical protein
VTGELLWFNQRPARAEVLAVVADLVVAELVAVVAELVAVVAELVAAPLDLAALAAMVAIELAVVAEHVTSARAAHRRPGARARPPRPPPRSARTLSSAAVASAALRGVGLGSDADLLLLTARM